MKTDEHISNEPLGLASIMEKISAFKNMSLREKLQSGKENLQRASSRLKGNSESEEDKRVDAPLATSANNSYNTTSSRYSMTDNRSSSDEDRYNNTNTRYNAAYTRYSTEDNRYNTADTRYTATDNRHSNADVRNNTADLRHNTTADLRHNNTADLRHNTVDVRHNTVDNRQNTAAHNLSFTGKVEPVDAHKNKGKMTRNLEKLFSLDRSNLLSSDHTTSFYKSTKNKIIIFEKDISEIPSTVTIKDGTKVYVYTVKYKADYTPILYPAYDEKEIAGDIIYMDNEEIWYKDFHKLTLGYNNGTSMEFHVVRMSELPGVKEEDLVPYVKRYFAINRSPKMSKLVKENALLLNNIIKMSDNYLIYRHVNNSYSIFVYSYAILGFNEIKLERLPAISMSSYDALLSPEILRFILENKFPLEEFEEKGGYIEYTKEIGRNRITLMRFKL